jgi:hypothetical protein
MYWNFVAIDGVIKNQLHWERILFLDDGDSKKLRNTENVYQSLLMETVTSFRSAEHQFHGDNLSVDISLHLLAVKTSNLIVRETVGLLNCRKHAELWLRSLAVPYLPTHRLHMGSDASGQGAPSN